jgi:hypothetical protein
MDPNTQKALLIGLAILCAICCCISSIVGGYYAYRSSTTSTTSTTSSTSTTVGTGTGTVTPPRPTGFNTITAPNEYGCPAQTFSRTSPNASGEPVWIGNASGDSVRNLVFDATQNKLYCCRDPNRCNYAKGGWFYGWDINDSRLTYG